ncbi:hypothetical protein BG004_001132 [Podila humilis]|nr:hypothetical protein BG004_001132 [Podila humilis]
MSQNHDDDDFAPTMTAGYKPGEKKSVNELQNLDANDESLRRWKESLGIAGSGVSKLDDPNNVVVLQLALEVNGRPDVILDLTKSAAELKSHVFTIKEGAEYRLKFLSEEAPSGMLARGHYEAKSKFVDDDGTVHKEWSWAFDIKKEWH